MDLAECFWAGPQDLGADRICHFKIHGGWNNRLPLRHMLREKRMIGGIERAFPYMRSGFIRGIEAERKEWMGSRSCGSSERLFRVPPAAVLGKPHALPPEGMSGNIGVPGARH